MSSVEGSVIEGGEGQEVGHGGHTTCQQICPEAAAPQISSAAGVDLQAKENAVINEASAHAHHNHVPAAKKRRLHGCLQDQAYADAFGLQQAADDTAGPDASAQQPCAEQQSVVHQATTSQGPGVQGTAALHTQGSSHVAEAAAEVGDLLDAAHKLLDMQQWSAVHQLLAPRLPLHQRSLMQALAVAGSQLHGARREWWAVLRLQQPAALEPGAGRQAAKHVEDDVRRQYRRLAALVHPDKCGLPGAAEAFQYVSQAASELCSMRAEPKNPGCDGDDHQHWSSGQGGFDREDRVEEEAGYAWWGRWECTAFEEALHANAEARSTVPSQQDMEDSVLWEMPIQELRAEVVARQKAVFSAGSASAHDRQRRLRSARTVLSSRLSSAAPEGQEPMMSAASHPVAGSQATLQPGGFIPEF
eukprot:CAMPEP_0202905606 /NCGR_PEP_ID=MMETSP1392-20130828/35172_1 /ASSEMBLY_ACC=CAM_ASM_000868 /TAXON_ID=225041 /ORGANISM="Chlamydomonas chlamydogama, Strain SAG 11-48b" /LENGTH=415 /DNA_ID=CAMNT_0049593783 /DNA_START=484 /DNA_END=1731 /DNA_ORIENTATION=-